MFVELSVLALYASFVLGSLSVSLRSASVAPGSNIDLDLFADNGDAYPARVTVALASPNNPPYTFNLADMGVTAGTPLAVTIPTNLVTDTGAAMVIYQLDTENSIATSDFFTIT